MRIAIFKGTLSSLFTIGPLTRASRVVAALVLTGALAAGIWLTYVAPPMSGPDEPFHWQRAVQISEGGIFSRKFGPNTWGGKIDSGAYKMSWWYTDRFTKGEPIGYQASLDAVKEMSDAPRALKTSVFSSTAVFSALAYLPQGFGVAAARLGGADLLGQFHAGRLVNLLVYLALVGLIVCVVPFGGFLLLALLVGPQAVHLAATHSADPLNTAFPLLLMAWCLRLRFDEATPFGSLQRRGLTAMAMMLGLLKPTTFLFSALILAIPVSRFENPRAMWRWRLLTIGGSAAIAVAWSIAYPFKPGAYWGSGGDPAVMIPHILSDLPQAARYLWNTIRVWTSIMWTDSYTRFGGHPAPFTVFTDPAHAFAALYGLVALAIADAARQRDATIAALFSAIAVAVYLVVLIAFWIAFTALTDVYINGLQGRYLMVCYALIAVSIALLAPAGRWLGWARPPLLVAILTSHVLTLRETAIGYPVMWAP